MTNIAVVVPIYRNHISHDEMYSLTHIVHYLESFPKFFICPENMQIQTDLFEIVKFSNGYFESIKGYNRLMLGLDLYSRFSQYEYILLVQLDALVLSSNLKSILNDEWDYIGAPWFTDRTVPAKGFMCAGNGGFSLRHVPAFTKVLTEGEFKANHILDIIFERPGYRFQDLNTIQFGLKQLKKLDFLRNALQKGNRFIQDYHWNEDNFWACRASFFLSEFRVASVEASLRFSFEMHPRYCLQQNQNRLPFGCHAWFKYDREFWEPFLISPDRLHVSRPEMIRFKK